MPADVGTSAAAATSAAALAVTNALSHGGPATTIASSPGKSWRARA
jgi:hypothetical protein